MYPPKKKRLQTKKHLRTKAGISIWNSNFKIDDEGGRDPPDLFSDDGTLTPDALKDGEGTDESPLHLGNAKKYGQTGIPTDRLKKIRINRKDLKKGGDGLRGKNVMDQYRVKDKDMKRTMK